MKNTYIAAFQRFKLSLRPIFLGVVACVFFTLSSMPEKAMAQTSINLNGQKIEWRFHKYYMTRAQMQAIVDKPANERVILIPLMVKLPSAFAGKKPILGAGMVDYELRDPKTGLGSIEIAHHLAYTSPTGANFFNYVQGRSGDILTGELSVIPGIETYYGGGMGWQKAPTNASHEIPVGIFDSVFYVPFYVNKVGSFDVCLKAQSNTACQTIDPSWPKCPGQYAFNTNYFSVIDGKAMINSATDRSDFFQDNFGLFDPNSQFNSYNICGGVQILESPTAVFDALDSACPQSPFAFNAFAFASQNLNDFKILAALNNDNFNISINSNNGSYTAVGMGGKTFTYTVTALPKPADVTEPFYQGVTVTIDAENVAEQHGLQFKVEATNSNGTGYTINNKSSQRGLLNARAKITVPTLPATKLVYFDKGQDPQAQVYSNSTDAERTVKSGNPMGLRVTPTVDNQSIERSYKVKTFHRMEMNVAVPTWQNMVPNSMSVDFNDYNGVTNAPTVYRATLNWFEKEGYACPQYIKDSIYIMTPLELSLNMPRILCPNATSFTVPLNFFSPAAKAVDQSSIEFLVHHTSNETLKAGTPSSAFFSNIALGGVSGQANNGKIEVTFTIKNGVDPATFDGMVIRARAKETGSPLAPVISMNADSVVKLEGKPNVVGPDGKISFGIYDQSSNSNRDNQVVTSPAGAYGTNYYLARSYSAQEGISDLSSLGVISLEVNKNENNPLWVKEADRRSLNLYEFVVSEYQQFRITMHSVNGCEYKSDPKYVKTEKTGNPAPSLKSLYGEVACVDTIKMIASVPDDLAGKVKKWYWIGLDYNSFEIHTFNFNSNTELPEEFASGGFFDIDNLGGPMMPVASSPVQGIQVIITGDGANSSKSYLTIIRDPSEADANAFFEAIALGAGDGDIYAAYDSDENATPGQPFTTQFWDITIVPFNGILEDMSAKTIASAKVDTFDVGYNYIEFFPGDGKNANILGRPVGYRTYSQTLTDGSFDSYTYIFQEANSPVATSWIDFPIQQGVNEKSTKTFTSRDPNVNYYYRALYRWKESPTCQPRYKDTAHIKLITSDKIGTIEGFYALCLPSEDATNTVLSTAQQRAAATSFFVTKKMDYSGITAHYYIIKNKTTNGKWEVLRSTVPGAPSDFEFNPNSAASGVNNNLISTAHNDTNYVKVVGILSSGSQDTTVTTAFGVYFHNPKAPAWNTSFEACVGENLEIKVPGPAITWPSGSTKPASVTINGNIYPSRLDAINASGTPINNTNAYTAAGDYYATARFEYKGPNFTCWDTISTPVKIKATPQTPTLAQGTDQCTWAARTLMTAQQADVSYQWKLNGTNISVAGANADVLSFNENYIQINPDKLASLSPNTYKFTLLLTHTTTACTAQADINLSNKDCPKPKGDASVVDPNHPDDPSKDKKTLTLCQSEEIKVRISRVPAPLSIWARVGNTGEYTIIGDAILTNDSIYTIPATFLTNTTNAPITYHIFGKGLNNITSDTIKVTIQPSIVLSNKPSTIPENKACVGSTYTINNSITVTPSGATAKYIYNNNVLAANTISATAGLVGVGKPIKVFYTFNGCPSDTVKVDSLRVVALPVITAFKQSSVDSCTYSDVQFVATTSTATPSFTWFEGSNTLSDGGSYSGSTTHTLTIKADWTALAGKSYKVRVSADGCSTDSPALVLTKGKNCLSSLTLQGDIASNNNPNDGLGNIFSKVFCWSEFDTLYLWTKTGVAPYTLKQDVTDITNHTQVKWIAPNTHGNTYGYFKVPKALLNSTVGTSKPKFTITDSKNIAGSGPFNHGPLLTFNGSDKRNIANPSTVCAGEVTQLSMAAGTTMSFNTGARQFFYEINGTQVTQTVAVNATAIPTVNYTAKPTDAPRANIWSYYEFNGCYSDTIKVDQLEVNRAPVIAMTAAGSPACGNSPLTMTIGGANILSSDTVYFYKGSVADANIIGKRIGPGTFSFNGDILTVGATTIVARARAKEGCWSAQVTASVTVNSTPDITSASVTGSPVCKNGSYQLALVYGTVPTTNVTLKDATFANTLNTFTSGLTGTLTVPTTAAGYVSGSNSVKVIATSGSCTDTATVTVVVNPLPTAGTIAQGQQCKYYDTYLKLSGHTKTGTSVLWYDNATNTAIATDNTNYEVVAHPDSLVLKRIWDETKTYYAVVTDANTCSSKTAVFTLTFDGCAPPAFDFTLSGPSCFVTGAKLEVTALTGTPPYKIEVQRPGDASFSVLEAAWTQTTYTYNNASVPGAYNIRITDANNKTQTRPWTIKPKPAIAAMASSVDPLCQGTTTNLTAVGVSVSGASSGIKVSYFLLGATANLGSSTAGPNYSYTVTSAQSLAFPTGSQTLKAFAEYNGCYSDTVSKAITVKLKPVQPVVAAVADICKGQDANFAISSNLEPGAAVRWAVSTTPPTGGLGAVDTKTYTYSNPTITASTAAPFYSSYNVTATVELNGCSSDVSTAQTLKVFAPAAVTGITSSKNPICTADKPTLTATGIVGTVQKWEKQDKGSSVWTDLGSTANPYTLAATLSDTTTFRVSVINGPCTTPAMQTIRVDVLPAPVAAQIIWPTKDVSACAGTIDLVYDTVNSKGTSFTWFSNGIAMDPSYNNRGRITVPFTTTTTYTVQVYSASGSVTCGNAISNARKITVTAPTSKAVLANITDLCVGGTPDAIQITGVTNADTLQWYKKEEGASTWQAYGGKFYTVANAQQYFTNNVGAHTVSTEYYLFTQNGSCPPENSDPAKIVVYPQAEIVEDLAPETQPVFCYGGTGQTLKVSVKNAHIVGWIRYLNYANDFPSTTAYNETKTIISTLPAGAEKDSLQMVLPNYSKDYNLFIPYAAVNLTKAAVLNGCKNDTSAKSAKVQVIAGVTVDVIPTASANEVCKLSDVKLIAKAKKVDAMGYPGYDTIVWYRCKLNSLTNCNTEKNDYTNPLNWERLDNGADIQVHGKHGDSITIKNLKGNVASAIVNSTDAVFLTAFTMKGSCNSTVTNVFSSHIITVNDSTVPGAISKNDTICQNENGTVFSLTGGKQTDYKWFDSIPHAATWNQRGTNTTYTGATYAPAPQTTHRSIRAQVQNRTCPPLYSNIAVLDTFARAVGGKLSVYALGTKTDIDAVCEGTKVDLDTTANYTPYRGFATWQISMDKTTWSATTKLNSNPSLSAAQPLDGKMAYYRALITNGKASCPASATTIDSVRVDRLLSFAQNIQPTDAQMCEAEVELKHTASLGANGSLVRWEMSENNTTSYAAMAGSAGQTAFKYDVKISDPTLDQANFYFRQVVKNGSCPEQVNPNPLTKLILRQPKATKLKRLPDTVCPDATLSYTLPAGHVGSIQWQITDGRWEQPYTNLSGKTTATLSVSTNAEIKPHANFLDTTYSIRAQFGKVALYCVNQYSDSVSVTVLTKPVAGSTPTALKTNLCVSSDSIYVNYATPIQGYYEWYMKEPGATTYQPTGFKGATGTPMPLVIRKPLKIGTYEFKMYAWNNKQCTDTVKSPMASVVVWDSVQLGTIAPLESRVCQNSPQTFTAKDHISIAGASFMWIYRVNQPNIGTWNTSTQTSSASATITMGAMPAYNVALIGNNPGCPTYDTSNIVLVHTTATPVAPVLSITETPVCKDSMITLTFKNVVEGDSIEIYRSLNGAATQVIGVIPRTANEMSFKTPKNSVGTNQFSAKLFYTGMKTNPCASVMTNKVSLTVNDSSRSGRILFANGKDTLSIIKGKPVGVINSTGYFGTYFQGQNENVADKAVRQEVFQNQSGWTTHSWGGSLINGNGFDTVYYRLIARSEGCPQDTSNEIKLTLRPSDAARILASKDHICINATASLSIDKGAITADNWYPNGDGTTQYGVRSWERMLYSADGKTLLEHKPTYKGANVENFTENYATTAPQRAGLYRYVVHYAVAGDLNRITDTIDVLVDTLTVKGAIYIGANPNCKDTTLCQDSIGARLTLSGNNGAVQRWTFATTSSFSPETSKLVKDTIRYTTGNQPADSGYYRVWVKNGLCPEIAADPVMVRIHSRTVPGTLASAPANPCYRGSDVISISGHNGMVSHWIYSKDNGLKWDTIPNIPISKLNYTFNGVKDTLKYRAIVLNTSFCTPESTPLLTVYAKDTIVFEINKKPYDSVFESATSVSMTVKAIDTVRRLAIPVAYQWQSNATGAWVNLSNNADFAGVTTATLTVQASYYKNNKDVFYRCRASHNACNDVEISDSGRIYVKPTLDAGIIDPRCLFIDSTYYITPGILAAYGVNIVGDPMLFDWYWTSTAGVETKLTGTEPWILGGFGTDSLKILADKEALAGTSLRLQITDYYGVVINRSYAICMDSMPLLFDLANDTVCVNDLGMLALHYERIGAGMNLNMKWFGLKDVSATKTDTIAIPHAQFEHHTVVNDLDHGFASMMQTMPSLLKYDEAFYQIVVSSNTHRLDYWTSFAQIFVVDSIRMDQAIPRDTFACQNGEALLLANVSTDVDFRSYQWLKLNPLTSIFDSVAGADTMANLHLLDVQAADSGYYRLVSSNICNTVYSRIAFLRVEQAPVVTMPDDITLCEGELVPPIWANVSGKDTTMTWLVNNTKAKEQPFFTMITINPDGTGGSKPFFFHGTASDTLHVGLSGIPDFSYATADMNGWEIVMEAGKHFCPNLKTRDTVRLIINAGSLSSLPTDQTVDISEQINQHVFFTVDSIPNATYQWLSIDKYTDDILGTLADDATYTGTNSHRMGVVVTDMRLDSTRYACIVTSLCGTDTSRFARLFIVQGTRILSRLPDTINVCTDDWSVDTILRLYAESGGSKAQKVGYNWQFSDDGGWSWYPVSARYYKAQPDTLNKPVNDSLGSMLTILPVKGRYHNLMYRCLVNNAKYSDTTVLRVNFIPYWAYKGTLDSVMVWQQLFSNDELANMGPGEYAPPGTEPHRHLRIGAAPALASEVIRIFDIAPGDLNQPGTDQKIEDNLVQYVWWRAERGSDAFAPTSEYYYNYDASSGPVGTVDDPTNAWWLENRHAHTPDDSIRIIAQIRNTYCEGLYDTILLRVPPPCNLDSVDIPDWVCPGSSATFTVHATSAKYNRWYVKKPKAANGSYINMNLQSNKDRYTIVDGVLTIKNVTLADDSLMFAYAVCDYTPSINDYMMLRVSRAAENVTLSGPHIQMGILEVLEGTNTTVTVSNSRHEQGFTYEWYLQDLNDPASFPMLINTTTDRTWANQFQMAQSGLSLFVKVISPNNCFEVNSDTVLLQVISPLEIDWETSDIVKRDPVTGEWVIKACEYQGGVIGTRIIKPEDPQGMTYSWYYRQNVSSAWTILNDYDYVFSVTNEPILEFYYAEPEMSGWQFICVAQGNGGSKDTTPVITFMVGSDRVDLFQSRIDQISPSANNICSNVDRIIYLATVLPKGPGITYDYTWIVDRLDGRSDTTNSISETYILEPIDITYHGATVRCLVGSRTCGMLELNRLTIQVSEPHEATVKMSVDSTQLCSSGFLTFTATSPDMAGSPIFKWQMPKGSPEVLTSINSVSVRLPAGVQDVTVELIVDASANTCVSKFNAFDTLTVDVLQGPAFDVTVDPDYLVPGDSAMLMIVMDPTSDGPFNYEWVPNTKVYKPFEMTTFTYPYMEAGMSDTIIARVTDAKGCVGLDTAIVRVKANFVIDSILTISIYRQPSNAYDTIVDTVFYDDRGVARVCATDILVLRPQTTGGVPPLSYHWSKTPIWPEGDYSHDSIFYFKPEQDNEIYELTVTDAIGNVVTGKVRVDILQAPYVNLLRLPPMFKDIYYFGQAIYYHAQPARYVNYAFYKMVMPEAGGDYMIVDSVKSDKPIYATSYAKGEDSNRFIVVVRDQFGCYNADTIATRLIGLPNVFVPDATDFEENRVFVPDFEVEIFDSWGLRIKPFGTRGWDGTYKGQRVKTGTYYYNVRIPAPTPEGFVVVTGAITVLRPNQSN